MVTIMMTMTAKYLLGWVPRCCYYKEGNKNFGNFGNKNFGNYLPLGEGAERGALWFPYLHTR